MTVFEMILISVALAMDAFATSISKGLSIRKLSMENAISVGLWFGIFQFLMPVIGFFLGSTFESVITSVDHWVAFILLCFIGLNMIIESRQKEGKVDFSFEEAEENRKNNKNSISSFNRNLDRNIDDNINFKSMFILALATSIDALAVGIAYVCAYGNKNALLTFTFIGVITFFISVIGVVIGNKFGDKYKEKAEFAGGLILILLGCEILLEHLGLFENIFGSLM